MGAVDKQPEIKLQGYLKRATLDQHGAKQVTFEFSAADAVELAKLELMSRDLVDRQPVLLEITARVNQDAKDKEKKRRTKQRRYDFTKAG